MSGTGYPNGAPDDGRSPRRSTPRRIGWRTANRILDGQGGGRGTEDLRAFIAIASTPTPTDPRQAGAERAESALPHALRVAFQETAAAPPTSTERSARRNSTPRALALRFAASILVVCGAGVVAASAGVLPAGMQRIAHDYFGVGSAPAQSTQAPSPSSATSGTSAGDSPSPQTTSGVVPMGTVVALCRQVPQTGSDWHAGLSTADQTTLITAAGGDHKVKQYCSRLLESAANSPKPTPSPETTGAPTSIPSVRPTQTHGNPHPSHSPTTRSTTSH